MADVAQPTCLPQIAHSIVLFATILFASGCCGLSGRCPSHEQTSAAREQGQLALQFLHRGRLDEADARFTHAIENCPEDVRLRHDLAVVRREQGRVPEAITEMKRAVAKSHGEPEWLSELATLQLSQGDLAGAWESADQAVNRDPSLACAWRVRGDIFKQSSRYEDALRDYHRALAEGDNSPEILMDVAEVYRNLGRPRRALSTLQRLAASIAPEDHPRQLAYHRALAYQALERHDEAELSFCSARSVLGENPHLLQQLAISQWELGKSTAARETLFAASQMAPQNPQIIDLFARWQRERPAGPRVAAAH